MSIHTILSDMTSLLEKMKTQSLDLQKREKQSQNSIESRITFLENESEMRIEVIES
jgi:hypothetical protein